MADKRVITKDEFLDMLKREGIGQLPEDVKLVCADCERRARAEEDAHHARLAKGIHTYPGGEGLERAGTIRQECDHCLPNYSPFANMTQEEIDGFWDWIS